jgi:predicted nucleic acid-binding Zn ribbon protein
MINCRRGKQCFAVVQGSRLTLVADVLSSPSYGETNVRGRGKITGIDNLLQALVADRNWAVALNRHRLFDFWAEAVGREVAAHARPKVIRKQVLHVEVTDSVWMQQLHLQKSMLLDALNRRLGPDGLTDIRFTLNFRATFAQPPSLANPSPLPPDPEKLAEFEQLLSAIKDEGVRDSMKSIWLAQQGRE